MKRATITIPDDLEADIQEYISRQQAPPSLTSVVQAALRRFLLDQRLEERQFEPAKGPFRITPARKGSGKHDVAERHDDYLTESP